MNDLLRIALHAMRDVDTKILPTQVGINLAEARNLIKNHLDKEAEKTTAKPAKKKAKRKTKVSKKK
jgi:hypothetical protein